MKSYYQTWKETLIQLAARIGESLNQEQSFILLKWLKEMPPTIQAVLDECPRCIDLLPALAQNYGEGDNYMELKSEPSITPYWGLRGGAGRYPYFVWENCGPHLAIMSPYEDTDFVIEIGPFGSVEWKGKPRPIDIARAITLAAKAFGPDYRGWNNIPEPQSMWGSQVDDPHPWFEDLLPKLEAALPFSHLDISTWKPRGV